MTPPPSPADPPHDGVPARIVEWAHLPGPQRILHAIRARIENDNWTTRSTWRADLTDHEAHDIGVLLGIDWLTGRRNVTARRLDAALATYGTTLRAVITAASGPLQDVAHQRRAEQAAAEDDLQAARRIMRAIIDAHTATARHPPAIVDDAAPTTHPASDSTPADGPPPTAADLTDGAVRWIFHGTPKSTRLGIARQVETVYSRLDPDHDDMVRLAVLAASATGDAHALDRSRALGRVCARTATVIAVTRRDAPPLDSAPQPADTGDRRPAWTNPTASADAWRASWSGVGVACDDVSSTVLVAGLTLHGDAPACRLTSAAAVTGEPVWLTARSLRGTFTMSAATDMVSVCENPSVVEAAADAHGPDIAPLICTYGRPGIAAMALLRAVSQAGVPVRVSVDHDDAGRGILRTVRRLIPQAAAWRTDSATYEEEVIEQLVAGIGIGDGRPHCAQNRRADQNTRVDPPT